ncbi:MAG TPA: PepSY domain-containing protein [Steroidobacteraceae bacterium]|nr:PepSY domain-containing protein [Steroidobacteraceae bacterium]
MIRRRGHTSWATGLLAVLAVVAAAAAPASAERITPATPWSVDARFVADDSEGQRERIIEAVQKRFNAKVVRVTDTTVNGRPALELRLLSEQRVWNLVVDATTGQILSGA